MRWNVAQQLREQFIGKEQKRLKQVQAEVEEELLRLRESMQTEVDVEPDEGDAEIFEREKNAALIAVLERRSQDIAAALQSIDNGTYGTCARCGNAIEIERLEVKPDATLCITCQTEVERMAKRNRPTRQVQW
jgi:RNA polymerase-binding protein DksA